MRKLLPILVLLVAALAAYQFLWKKKDTGPNIPKDKPLAIGENSGTFNESFTKMLTSYYAVRDALFASDTAKASAAAHILDMATDSLKINEIKGDSTGTIKGIVKDLAGSISGSAKALSGEKNIEGKRKEFAMIADYLWQMIQTVKFSGQKVYLAHCPMAFNNQGANWVSDSRDIKNPFFGSAMPDCGEVQDSLDFSKK